MSSDANRHDLSPHASVRSPSDAVRHVIEFLLTMGRLKDTPRTGWVDNAIPSPESVSDHMYRMSLLCMMCPDTTLDRDRMIKMALCHDAGESIIGDISPKMAVPAEEKKRKEMAAVRHLAGLVAGGATDVFSRELHDLFVEYETQETAESHFVRDMDLLEMIVQAYQYEEMHPGKDLVSFFHSGRKIRHPWAREIYEGLVSTRPFLRVRQNH